ncbi:MAG: DUF1345 domain-containing protein [Candidatus Competibacteraceae bacterium]|nr:DUF1345 domain-containing protein [Candidatus Competibacteraceae bacterium]
MSHKIGHATLYHEQHPLHDLHWSARLSALGRQALAIAPALAVGTLTPRYFEQGAELSWLAAWCTYCAVELALIWFLALRLDAQATRRRAQWNDPGALMLFVLVTLACCASLAAVALVIDTGRNLRGLARWVHLGVMLSSLAGAWLLIQTVFASHYARVYYRPPPAVKEPARGLSFPDDQEPDYLDFLYYAAVIGMTSQVSDVTTRSRPMRRLTLIHGLLSFGFNLIVLAIAVNVFASSLS